MDTARLSLRPGETIQLFESMPKQAEAHQVYMVALIETPPFAGPSHAECNSYVVICAKEYEALTGGDTNLWGWVQMDYSTKDEIGEYMLENDANDGQWYYLVVEQSEV
jgi:hypothetical protein